MFRQYRRSKRLSFACLITVGAFVSACPLPAQIPDLGMGASLHGKQLFPDDNAWNQDISQWPINPNSIALLTSIGLTAGLHPDFGTMYNGVPNGIPYIVVSGAQPTVPVTFQYTDESDPGPYPLPAGAPIEGGPGSTGDRHVLVVNRDNGRLYELYSAYPNAGYTVWTAASGAVFNLASDTPRPEGWTSADAAGLPIFPGLVRYDEVYEQRAILHALRFTVQRTRHGFIYPARHFASNQTASNLPPMGMRVRLRAAFDVSNFPASVQVILRALKKYGMLVADNGSNWYLSGAPDSRWDDSELHTLGRVHGSDFEVVQMGPVTTDALAAPRNLRAAAGAGSVMLNWSAGAGAAGYLVKRSFFPGGPYTAIANVSAANAVDTTGTAGTPAYYVVSGVSADQQSFDSEEATVPAVQISGTLTLEGCLPSAVSAQSVTFAFRAPGTTAALFTRTQVLSADSTFTLSAVPVGSYDVAIQGAKWLRKAASVNAAFNVTGLAVTLPAGDMNGDNRVDIADFGAFVNAYGGQQNDPGVYNPNADFNCDGSVDIVDFGLMVNNYGTVGDE